jgi:hypothetical protein
MLFLAWQCLFANPRISDPTSRNAKHSRSHCCSMLRLTSILICSVLCIAHAALLVASVDICFCGLSTDHVDHNPGCSKLLQVYRYLQRVTSLIPTPFLMGIEVVRCRHVHCRWEDYGSCNNSDVWAISLAIVAGSRVISNPCIYSAFVVWFFLVHLVGVGGIHCTS